MPAPPAIPATIVPGGDPGAKGWRRALAQVRFAVALMLTVTGFLLWLRSGFSTPPATIVSGLLPVVLAMLAALTYSTMGLLLTVRRPEVRIGALEAWVGILVAALAFAWGYLTLAAGPVSGGPQPGTSAAAASSAGAYMALAAAVIVTPLLPALLVAIGLLFPTDRFASPRWRGVVLLAGAGAVTAAVGRLLRPGALTFVGSYVNPLGVAGLETPAGYVQFMGFAALGIAAVLTGWCLIWRYGGGDATERAQLRVFTAVTVLQAIAFVLFVATFAVPAGSRSDLRDTIILLNLAIFAAGPLAVALAIGRYRLYEIDHVIGRTFVYGALTAILAGMYAASLRLFETLFKAVTGESSDAALVITALILTTTFTPIKNRLEDVLKRLTHDPAVAAGPAASGTTGDGEAVGAARPPAQPGPALNVLEDPSFEMRIRELIRAELELVANSVGDSPRETIDPAAADPRQPYREVGRPG